MSAPAPRRADVVGRALFALGVVTLPFENFRFAPSKGWAAIAPIFFALYVLWNVRRLPESVVRLRRVWLVLGAIVALSSLSYLRHPPLLFNWMDAARSLGLGVAFLVALDLRFADGHDPGPALRLVAAAFAAALLLGAIQFLAIKLGWDDLVDLHRAAVKRDVLRAGRVQFGFTEPAFASMHVFGVLLPLAICFRRRREARWIVAVLVGFIGFGLLTRFSLRFVLDGLVVLTFAVGVRLARGAHPLRDLVIGALLLGALGTLTYQKSPRLRRIVTNGVYADGSLASRWFRVQASAIGWMDDPVSFVLGHGLGNLWVPVRAGYDEAAASYASDYRREVAHLAERRATTVLSMHVRVISEFGVVAYLVLLVLLFDRRRPFSSLVILYVYLQFDSYAFYAIWLHVHAMRAPRSPTALS